MPGQATTWLQLSAYRFWLRRIECALLGEATGRPRARSAALAAGSVVTAIAVTCCALLGLLRPQVALDRAKLVMDKDSGALFVRVDDTWHPVLNLASARLIVAAPVNPQPVRPSDLAGAKRGPPLGIAGAPQYLGAPLAAEELAWSVCDTDDGGATTVILGRAAEGIVRRLDPAQAILAASAPGSPAYLLYDGRRAAVNLDDAAVVRALRLEGRVPRRISQSLLDAVPEAPPIAVPRVPGAGGRVPGLAGFSAGAVLRVARADGDEFYVTLPSGVQRIGQVAADLLRFGDSRGGANPTPVAPDAIRASPIVTGLPVGGFPERAPTLSGGAGTACVTREGAGPDGVALLVGAAAPIPPGRSAATLAQADGSGPAVDAVYVPPGRSAYVRGAPEGGTRYLITDTGVRFAIPDDDTARALGLAAAAPAPWPVLRVLPLGPQLSRQGASVARDTVGPPP